LNAASSQAGGSPVPLGSRWPAPTADGQAGAGLAILVNAHAKRGGRRVAVQIGRALPGASVRLTKSTQEIDAWLRVLPKPRAVFAAGGDGTAVALVNALDRVTPKADSFPPVGVLPLGTGNGWAHALGGPKLHRCLELLAQSPRRLATRRCNLLDVQGTLAHFAGCGWDAMILEDYRRQLDASRGPGRHFSKSVYGYVSAAFLRTAPKVAIFGNPRVVIENLGDEVFSIDSDGRPRRLEGVGPGAVLYDGPAGAASAGTCPEFGYRFRAFPFAERMPGFVNVRVYKRGALGAIAAIPLLWKGTHPLGGMHDWLATHVRMSFSRAVPLQIGGDAHGLRRAVEFRAAEREIRMIDWRRMLCAPAGPRSADGLQ
jgi:diacylglycerol kinase family enzyme